MTVNTDSIPQGTPTFQIQSPKRGDEIESPPRPYCIIIYILTTIVLLYNIQRTYSTYQGAYMYQLSIPSVIHRWCYQMLEKCQFGRSKTRHVLKQNEQFGYPQYNIVASAQSPHYTKLATTSHTIMQIRHISTDRCPESVASLVWVTPGADFNGVTPSQLALVEHPHPTHQCIRSGRCVVKILNLFTHCALFCMPVCQ